MTKEFDTEKELFEVKRLTATTSLEAYLKGYVVEDIKMIAELSENIGKLNEKHHKATNKIAELVKENKELKQTILLMEENQRQKEKFWKSGSANVPISLTYEEQPLEIKKLESDIYTLNKRLMLTEKVIKETQEENLVYCDILSTLLYDPEQAVDIYMQGRRRGELNE